MRLYLKLSKNREVIPFNYQYFLTGVIHKWIGDDNEEHGRKSLYSFSWFQNVATTKNGLSLTSNSYFFISAYDDELLKKILKGILESPEMFCGCEVKDVQIVETPQFTTEERFFLNSPVLIRKKKNEETKHITYRDSDFELLLTENLKSKMQVAGIEYTNVEVILDRSYHSPKTKLIDYNGIKNKVTLAPLIIKGTPEQIAFAWNVGIGHSTGIGFGALK